MVNSQLSLLLRNRLEDSEPSIQSITIAPTRVAAIVCDMWDAHWCAGATKRVIELAPPMNRLIGELRDRGALIIHSPSETMEFYECTPGREAAKASLAAHPAPEYKWMRLTPEIEGSLPIDDSDGGCDDTPACPIPKDSFPWRRQIASIYIADTDAITDIGAEAHSLLEAHEIELVLMMGVHTNMCVMGRPFGIRNLVTAGRKVALVRDMTDTMYNSRMRPFVNHFRGTELVVEHIERYWCPTITSDQVVGGEPFRFAEDED